MEETNLGIAVIAAMLTDIDATIKMQVKMNYEKELYSIGVNSREKYMEKMCEILESHVASSDKVLKTLNEFMGDYNSAE